MAQITLKQTGCTEYSFTFSISGITGDRQTFLYIPEKQEWVTLANCVEQGYIESFEATGNPNGRITVHIVPYIAELFPVWKVEVSSYSDGKNQMSVVLTAFTRFEWDGAEVKESGSPFDITAEDMNRLNKRGYELGEACGGGYAETEFWTENRRGDELYDIIMKMPAYALEMAVDWVEEESTLPTFMGENGSEIMATAQYVIAEVSAGVPCYAWYFNDVKNAYNSFFLEVKSDAY